VTIELLVKFDFDYQTTKVGIFANSQNLANVALLAGFKGIFSPYLYLLDKKNCRNI